MLKRRLAYVISIILLIQAMFSGIAVQAATIADLSSEGACVMDFDTGEILYEHNGNVPRIPASMTKIMNMYLVYEALENGEVSLDTVVPISQNVYNKSRNRLYQSVIPLDMDTEYTLDEMMDIIIVRSASGAAVAVAELLGGGSEEAFVQKMNNKAAEMGIDACYYDSCGIAENKISPIAMATLARNIITDYPDILVRSSKAAVDFHGTAYGTTNHLLDTYYYEGADGLKTGSTKQAKYCLCATAVRNGKRIITVTMAAPTVGQSFSDSAKLLDYGFIAAPKNDYIYYTDYSTFINGYEAPTFALKKGSEVQPLVFARDLSCYGFDVSYDDTSKTTTVTYVRDKKFTPVPTQPYKGKDGEAAFMLSKNNIRVFLNDGAELHPLEEVYNADGKICISTEEFSKIYNTMQGEKSTHIQTVYKEPEAVLPDGTKITSKSAYIMDYDTGKELFSFNGDSQRPAASIAKMMSVYVVLDAIKNGEISLDTIVPVSENVYNLSRLENYKMMVNLEYDEEYTVDKMLDMIVIDSAAACVTAVAELLCGSEKAFVDRMNQKAGEIGIGSVFYNGTGVCLNPETDKENLMSARDIAVMTRHMINDYPEILERTRQPSVEFHGKTYYNLNKMFTDYYYEGADGFKNGMTEASGYCMCGTAQVGGKRIITVTLPSDSNEARFTDTAKMFDYGFSCFGINTAKPKQNNIVIPTDKPVKIIVDGEIFADSMVIENTIMVPVTFFKEVGKKVEQNTISDESITLRLSPGSIIKEALNPITNEITKEEIKASPSIVNGVTYLPVKAIMEAFGAAVTYDQTENTLIISAAIC